MNTWLKITLATAVAALIAFLLYWGILIYQLARGVQADVQRKNGVFYEYDELIHYHFEISDTSFLRISSKAEKTEQEKQLTESIITFDRDIKSLDRFCENLEIAGFQAHPIDSSCWPLADSIFSVKPVEEYYAFACEPFYRDHFVFKRRGHIVGIANICFQCQQSKFHGSLVNTESFGFNGEFEAMRRLMDCQ